MYSAPHLLAQERIQAESSTDIYSTVRVSLYDLAPLTLKLMRLNHKDLEVLVPKAAGSLTLMTTRALLNFTGKGCRAIAENKKVLLMLTLSQMASLRRIAQAPAK